MVRFSLRIVNAGGMVHHHVSDHPVHSPPRKGVITDVGDTLRLQLRAADLEYLFLNIFGNPGIDPM